MVEEAGGSLEAAAGGGHEPDRRPWGLKLCGSKNYYIKIPIIICLLGEYGVAGRLETSNPGAVPVLKVVRRDGR